MTDESTSVVAPTDTAEPAPAPDAGVLPRLWPVWVILALQLVSFVSSITASIQNTIRFGHMMLGPAVCGLLFAIWLLFFSRLPWRERIGYPALAITIAVFVAQFVAPDVGITMWIYGMPLSMVAMAIGIGFGAGSPQVRAGLVASGLVLALGWFPLVQLGGFRGDYLPEFAWRWSPSAERRAIEASAVATPTDKLAAWTPDQAEWPGFRGPRGDGQVDSIASPLDWTSKPPQVRWRTPLGPGWSSFACVSGRLFTHEQRDAEEVVTCLDADTGAVLWRSGQASRFSDVVAGAGPRATPTYVDGKLYVFGAKAVLRCLDAATGNELWRRDLVSELQADIPVWGCSNSPLVTAKHVVVWSGWTGERGLQAYDRETGEPAWRVVSRGMNFSTPQIFRLAGREWLVFVDEEQVRGIDPTDGTVGWSYKPAGLGGLIECQPQAIGDDDLLVPLGDGIGTARLHIAREGESWKIEETWSTKQFKPSFNDFVVHQGHLYGFDQNIFACVDAATGKRKWKAGRYGFGQVILLPKADAMIVTTEFGEAVLLSTNPDKLEERGKIKLIEGKTWNHPAVAGRRLFLRNGAEAVAVDL